MNEADPKRVSPTTQETDPPPLTRSRQSLVVLSLALAALVFAAFQPALNNDFVGYDDPDYVTSNLMVQRGLNWDSVRWAFVSTEAANWHPLTWISHMLDVQLFALNPTGHHLTSLLLHTVSSVLLFLTLFTLTGATWRSLIVAALFGMHPLRVESVAWVAERKDVLSTLLWISTLLAYALYARAKGVNGYRAKMFYAMTLLCFALGLMAKPMLVTLPFVLLLLDIWPLKRTKPQQFSALVLEKLPLFVLTLASCIVTFIVQRSAGAVSEHTSLSYRLSNVVVSYVRYLGKTIRPADLAFFYPHPSQWPAIFVVGSVLLLLTISALAVRLRHRCPALLVGWLWFLGTLVPVIGLVQVGQQSIADRYTYIPSVGILIGLVWSIHTLISDRRRLTHLGIVSIAVAALCLLLTRQQTRVWVNTETLCRHAIAVVPRNYLAHDMLGAVFEKRGENDLALREHLRALDIKPDYADAHNNLAVALQHQGKLAKAVEHYQRAILLRPRYPEAHFNLGVALETAGQFDNAVTEYSKAIALRPGYADAHYNLGLVYGRLGRLDLAIAQFHETLRLNPRLADAHNNLGVTFDRMGQLDQAIEQYQQAVTLRPDYPRAHFNLGVALGKAGHLDAAANAFEAALRLKPDYAEAQTNLAAIRAATDTSATRKP